MAASGILGGPTADPPIREVLDRWAAQRGMRFVWNAERVITYAGSRAAWHARTRSINGPDDGVVDPTRWDAQPETCRPIDMGASFDPKRRLAIATRYGGANASA